MASGILFFIGSIWEVVDRPCGRIASSVILGLGILCTPFSEMTYI